MNSSWDFIHFFVVFFVLKKGLNSTQCFVEGKDVAIGNFFQVWRWDNFLSQ
jgi:hypothetical protein